MPLPLRDVALAVLGVVTVVLCVRAVTDVPGTEPSRTVGAAAVAEVSPVGASTAPSTAPSADPVRTVVVIGDGYATSPVHGFPLQVAKRTGWTVTTDAVAGTGYVAGTADLGARVAAAVARDPDLVVVALGLNDARDGVADDALTSAARDAFAALGGRRALVIGPFWPGTASPRAAAFDDLLAAQATEAGLAFVSPTDERWLSGVASDPRSSVRIFLDDDLVRPNAIGSKVITDRFEAHVRELGLV